MVGNHYRTADAYEVGREKIREYARAVQDEHPAHRSEDAAKALGYDGLLAPLTFFSLVGMLSQRRVLETIATGYDLSQILHTDQVHQYHQPIKAGDRLVCDVYLDSFRQIMGRDMMVTKNVSTNQNNELVQTTYTTLFVGRSGEIDESIAAMVDRIVMHDMSSTALSEQAEAEAAAGLLDDTSAPARPIDPPIVVDRPSAATQRFEDVAVGDELPAKVFRVSRGDLVNYAGVVGDVNPIHWHEEFAKAAGLDNVVAHGMLTMGLGGSYVSSWLGDPGAVKEYTVRFTSPVYVDSSAPAEIEYTGKVKSVDPETCTAVIALNATNNNKRIFGHRANVTVQLA